VLYKGKTLREDWCNNGPTGCVYNSNETGWMDKPFFTEWFIKVFVKFASKLNGPKLLLFDGHSSHINLDVINEARLNNIHIIVLPGNTTSILQPLDVCVFKSIKTKWKDIVCMIKLSNTIN
jgi:hypothetical protein